MLDQFSEELKKAREKSGVTLQQIAQKSRIDLKFIEAIDRGDFGFLPELYVKAFIKQYARNVGLDEQETLNKYDAAKRGRTIDEEEVEEIKDSQKHKPASTEERLRSISTAPVKSFEENFQKKEETETDNFFERLKNNRLLLGGVISGIAIILFLIIYFLFLKTSSNIVVAEKPYDQIMKENQQRYLEESNLPVAKKPTPVDSLTLKVTAIDSAWFQIRVDNSQILEFVLYPNASKTIKAATGFKVTIGNAGDTRLKLNDKSLNLSGKKKEVKYVSIDKNGLKYLEPPKNPDQE